jgi:hypothetical protein
MSVGIKHAVPYAGTKLPTTEYNAVHSIDDASISISKLSDHTKTSHDSLGLDAATLETHASNYFATSDHTHTPVVGDADTVDGHDSTYFAIADHTHTNMEVTTNKGAVSGYCGLDTTQKIATAYLGGVGADNTKYLRGDQTWVTPPNGVNHNLLDGSIHPDSVVGTVARGDIVTGQSATPKWTRLAKGSANQVLSMDASGVDVVWATSAAVTPAWKGAIAGGFGNGDPSDTLQLMYNNPINATPTNIAITVARISYFKLDTSLVVNKIRFFGVGATTNVYRVAIYQSSDLSRLTSELAFSTSSQTWGSVGSALNLTLAANTLYFIAVSVNTTGTTAGLQCISSTTGRIGVLPNSWTGNLALGANKIDACALAQFAVTSGTLPNPAATIAAQAAWTGGMPAFFLDNNNG